MLSAQGALSPNISAVHAGDRLCSGSEGPYQASLMQQHCCQLLHQPLRCKAQPSACRSPLSTRAASCRAPSRLTLYRACPSLLKGFRPAVLTNNSCLQQAVLGLHSPMQICRLVLMLGTRDHMLLHYHPVTCLRRPCPAHTAAAGLSAGSVLPLSLPTDCCRPVDGLRAYHSPAVP